MSGRDSPRVVVYGDEWAVTAAVCSLVSQRWPQAVVERASGLSALVQTLRRHGAAGVLLCLRPHEHIPVLDALTPVPSCGGDEGRRGGVTYGAEGEDSESVPASCAGGAGYGDGGGGGNAAVPRCAAAISGDGAGRLAVCRGRLSTPG
ncbi:TPA: hypothetical protein ACWPCK_005311 [Salmonella enterica]|uniref:hypothetical protein n=1 Tax=Salmonella sp. SG203 TaxID=2555397 RepID=UPI0015830364|nr:hypothetical protein [Salmonella sp. SG203]